jgi:hypothetical protein
LSIRLSKIDDLTRPDHFFLKPEDQCFYLGEYTARKGFQFSETNKLIYNLKKPMDRKGKPGWSYKAKAIEEAGHLLREATQTVSPTWLSTATLVPIPPSKIKGDPEYDDRVAGVLRSLASGIQVDICELVLQHQNMPAAHGSDVRPRLPELIANYFIDEKVAEPMPRVIGIVDDVLTTGAHFKAVQQVLRSRFPSIPSYGIFLARRTPDTSDI